MIDILNTRNYKEFCMREFGYFVHHTPGDGTRSFNMVNYKNVLQSLAEKKISHPDGVRGRSLGSRLKSLSSFRRSKVCMGSWRTTTLKRTTALRR